jgi:hypothetical protein
MIAAAWGWVLIGVAFVIVAGVAFMALAGVVGLPGDFLRRVGQTAGSAGDEQPEVPTASAEETARLVDDDQPS